MHLEKATSRSGSAALAGWIASNDVTLFTTVLVMAIAMSLYVRLSKESKTRADIARDMAAQGERLETAKHDLAASNTLLERTRSTLARKEDEHQAIESDLAEKLADLARLQAVLKALAGEKSQLESEQQALVAANTSLSKEKKDLATQHQLLVGDRDSLKSANSSLHERLEATAKQLEEKAAALKQIESERERLKHQADDLEKIVAIIKAKVEQQTSDLSKTRIDASAAEAALNNRIQELEKQLNSRSKTTDEYLAKLEAAAESLDKLTTEKTQLEQQLSASELQHQADLAKESRNNRALIGLTGPLERVAILFDASGSMREATATGTDRWAQAQGIAARWLQHLNVQQCVLIVYASTVQTFPADGSLADLRGETGKVSRDLLLRHVQTVSPGGGTNTFEALKKAYEYDVDSILLFSDGAPSSSTSGAFDPAMAGKIYELCRAHPHVPIHTVGLGNYFQEDTSTFLMSLAKITGGTFRGQ